MSPDATVELPVVVVIDDDETFAEMLTWSLERRGFRTVACSTPAAARTALLDHDVAAVVCDIELGAGVTGTALVAELRRQADRELPAVFVSGYRAEFVHLDDERDRFLQKPFALGELAELLTSRLTT
ncbi:MAG TPA: response regulator [Ilumatobacter sp.]|nr:response regulator [Ilumatobacter sp.]